MLVTLKKLSSQNLDDDNSDICKHLLKNSWSPDYAAFAEYYSTKMLSEDVWQHTVYCILQTSSMFLTTTTYRVDKKIDIFWYINKWSCNVCNTLMIKYNHTKMTVCTRVAVRQCCYPLQLLHCRYMYLFTQASASTTFLPLCPSRVHQCSMFFA